MSIYITGSTGFVGTNVVQYLQNTEIIPLGRADLSSFHQSLLGVDAEAIIHLAGKAHDLRKVTDGKEYYDINYEMTTKLYDAFLISNVSKFIFISSVKAAADTVDGILSESFAPSPKTDYGKSKLMAEDYIQSKPLPEGKSYYILRPCMIHGAGNKGNLNLLYKFVEKGLPYPLAAFDNKRSYLTVANLCFIIKELLDNDIPSGIYNVADEEPLSTKEVVKVIAASFDKKATLLNVSPTLIRAIARIGDKLKLPLTSERLTKLTESYVVDATKIISALNKKLPYMSREGLINTFRTFNK